MLNLFETEIQNSPLFSPLPRFDGVVFQGFLDEAIQHYEVSREGQHCTVLGATVIRKDEKFAWEACEELLERSVKEAMLKMQGVYRYDLLSFDVHREINAFNFQDLSQLMVNHSRKLAVGQQGLIKYCSQYGLLQKLNDANWGKITFKAHVLVYDKDPVQLDLLIKKVLRKGKDLMSPLSVVLNDQSLSPIFDEHNAEQRQRLIINFQKEFEGATEIPEVYLNDKRGSRELVSQLYQG